MISDDVVEVRCCGLYCAIEISDGSIAAQKEILLTRIHLVFLLQMPNVLWFQPPNPPCDSGLRSHGDSR